MLVAVLPSGEENEEEDEEDKENEEEKDEEEDKAAATEEGKDDELLGKLQQKTGKGRDELVKWINEL